MLKPTPGVIAEFELVRERLYATAFNALADRDAALAVRSFGMMAAMCPIDERPWLGLGAAQEQSENWDLALGFYRLGGRVAERSVWPLLGEARVLGKLGKPHEARAQLDRAEGLTNDVELLNQIERIRGEL